MYMLLKPDSMQCEDIHCNKMFVILTIPLSSELQGRHIMSCLETRYYSYLSCYKGWEIT